MSVDLEPQRHRECRATARKAAERERIARGRLPGLRALEDELRKQVDVAVEDLDVFYLYERHYEPAMTAAIFSLQRFVCSQAL